jgi:hypothetical protein
MPTTGSADADSPVDKSDQVSRVPSIGDVLYAGWSPAGDVPAAIRRLSPQQIADRVALVSVIDSTPRVAELPSVVPLLARSGIDWTRVGDDVALPAASLPELMAHEGLFTGFDEVWLFDATPSHGKPASIRITSDVRLAAHPSTELRKWMQSSGSIAGLGDGDGLNFVTREATLAELWRA